MSRGQDLLLVRLDRGKAAVFRGAAWLPPPQVGGEATISTWRLGSAPFERRDVHGDGRVVEVRSRAGRLERSRFYEIAAGVNLSSIPGRIDLELIFRHHGVPVTG